MPGWGGSQLLPNLIGIAGAAQVIMENPLTQKVLRPQQAAELGMADVLFEPADFLERSLEWAAGVVRARSPSQRPEVDRDMWDGVLFFARQQLDERLHGAVPSANRALELLALAKDAPFAEGTAAETEALADLMMGDESRASLYAFDLVQRRAKRPAGVPDKALARQVTKVGIVGAGLMASPAGAAVRPPAAGAGGDDRPGPGRGGQGRWATSAPRSTRWLGKGRMSEGPAAKLRGLVSGSVDTAVFADADFVIEAVFEDLDVKKQVWAELEKVVPPEAVLATNTCSLSVTAMAADLDHPERVVGFHFFNPVAVLPLVEVVKGERTDDATLATAFAVGKELKKSCVLVKDAPGVRGEPAAHPVHQRDLRGDRRGHADGGGGHRAGSARACRCGPWRCSSWSVRRWRCTSARRCTRRSRTGSGCRRTSRGSSRRAGRWWWTTESTPRWSSCWRPATRR